MLTKTISVNPNDPNDPRSRLFTFAPLRNFAALRETCIYVLISL
ncbi:MAG: hypothetical protein WCF67_08540 [Chitinophagaceae bacterium]